MGILNTLKSLFQHSNCNQKDTEHVDKQIKPVQAEPRRTLEYKLLYISRYSTVKCVKEYLERLGFSSVEQEIESAITNGLLKIATYDDKLQCSTVVELKKILTDSSLKVSGTTDELLLGIKENIPYEEYIKHLPTEDYLVRTDKGNARYKEILDHADESLYNSFATVANYILNNKASAAETYVSDYFNKNSNLSYIPHKVNDELRKIITSEYSADIYAVLCAYAMFGMAIKYDMINKYLTDKKHPSYTNDDLHNAFMYYEALYNLIQYKNDGVKAYEILSSNDNKACDKCKSMNGKHFDISQAKKGETLPPFCAHCRCTILPVIE